MKHKEIEFKYNASNVSLTDFETFCKSKGPHKFVMASGWDHFYSNSKDPDAFYRFRTGPDMNQLTYKCKNSDINNVIRDEQNVNLSRTETEEHVRSFLKRFKYEYVSSMFKSCFIYIYARYTLVYYVCYDRDMKESGRFIEIEMSEEHSWSSEQEAYNELVIIEKLCKPLGLTPQARVRKSLYEMFVKE